MSDESQLVDPKTLQFRRAIKDPKQAFSMYRRLVTENKLRTIQNAAIQRKLNDEQPWNPNKLKAAGESWRHNRSTGFMSSLVKRILPPYKQVIDTARVLTSSALKDESPEGKQKTEDFQLETTKCMRRWHGWHDLWSQVINENVVFGYTALNWSDEYDWKPTFLRTDDVLFPDGNPQEAEDTPMFARRQFFQIHELADKLVEPEISEDVGWNVENLVKAINAAQPENRRRGNQENLRKFEDTIRESTIGQSYSQGVKVVEAAHLFVKEATGKVSHFIIEARTGDDLMTHLDRFESMDQCLALFSIDIGNGKLQGSKGAGRTLYNTHVAVEQARNLIADNLYLASLLLLRSKQRSKQSVAITVTHPVCVVGEDYEVVEQSFNVNADSFFALDRHMTKIAEMQVGAFMPGLLADEGKDVRTASEVNYVASVEQQIKEGILARWWAQCLKGIFEMQKRIYSDDNIRNAWKVYQEETSGMIQRMSQKFFNFIQSLGKKIAGTYQIEEDRKKMNADAIQTCLCLMRKGLQPEDIFELAQTPPNSVTDDSTMRIQGLIDAIVLRYRGDPKINQEELMKRDISSKVGFHVAEALIIPEEDNTLQAEATRMQLIEMTSLLTGEPVPISPRDIDAIHMAVIQAKTADLIKTMTPEAVTPETMNIADNVLQHFDAHLQSAIAKGAKQEQMGEQTIFSKGTHDLINRLKMAMGKAPQNVLQLPKGAQPAVGPGSPSSPVEPPLSPAPPAGPTLQNPGNLPLSRGPADLSSNVAP